MTQPDLTGLASHLTRPSINTGCSRRRREVITGMNLDHPNITTVSGITEGKEFGGIVTPWCQNGYAFRYLGKHKLSRSKRYRLWLGVAEGLVYLHTHKLQIVHGDMKPPNVLIADHGRPMICDLVLSNPSSLLARDGYSSDESWSWTPQINTTRAHSGTPRYLAPGRVDLTDPSKLTVAANVYSLGCIRLEVGYVWSIAHLLPITLSKPSPQPPGKIFHDIRQGVPSAARLATAYSTGSSSVNGIALLWDIFERCWSRDPSLRPTASRLRDLLVAHESVIVSALERQA
ncbi:hypothetical protein PIIN_10057 [Serendipita indica DSM 11827]|uniref:Protein kinase domain-containing protein n=1 Tax=Serendipita indica (strain DSM 11827) TaxID=1109443 RepID=G4TXL4_SERID|nr:hypothetical protein PIIN_10057 [Serendipita indica DSM 11827]